MLIGDWRLVGFLNPRKCRQVLRLPEPSLKKSARCVRDKLTDKAISNIGVSMCPG